MSHQDNPWVPWPNIAKYKKKPPGPKSEYVRRRFTDLRTTEGRELAEVLRELETDLGPVSPGQKIILANVASQLAIVRAIVSWLDRQESVIQPDGRLLPILAENFITYTGALQRSILTAYALAGKKSHRTVDLESYIAGKKSAEGSNECKPSSTSSSTSSRRC